MLLVTANIFQPLIDVFEAVLKFFHNTGGIPWGWSIVLLTIAVRAVLVPLTFRQIKSMVRMQALGPQLKEIQAKYKEDKQRQQQEVMKFYKENNVNPLGSCLPLVLQLPVFISLYYMLRKSLRTDICPAIQRAHNHGVLSNAHTVACGSGHGASFLFIGDLTNKATGITLVVLIILYVGSQLASSILMSAATMDPTQRKIMMFMPLVFVLFVFRFPAGVLVYWITTNFWTMAQQYLVKKRIGPTQAVLATAGADAGGSAGGGSGSSGSRGPGPRGSSRSSASGTTGARGANGATAASPATGGGLGSMIRDRLKPPEPREKVSTGGGGGLSKSTSKSASKGSGGGNGATPRPAGGPPPKSPRKKKKRSGRRR